jgi:hypothetical protein
MPPRGSGSLGSGTRRRFLHGTAAAGIAWFMGAPAFGQVREAAGGAMAATARAFLATLSAEGRKRATFAFEDKERLNWHYVPRRREGLAFRDMSPASRTAAHELMKASLGGVGYDKAVNIIKLEGVLRQLELFGGMLRDPDSYAVSVFGTPAGETPWGWRIEGHHLSLNFTLVPGKRIAATPAFFGANPAEVRTGAARGLRALGREEDLGYELARGMDEGQRRRMVIGNQSLGDIVHGPGRSEAMGTPAGIPAADLGAAQRERLTRLLEEYARNVHGEVAEAELRRIREAGLERLHFAWAGSLERGEAHYYRIQGPSVLIELDNTQNDANHIHSVWRDPRNDFGADLLRAHYEHGHRHG